MKLSYLTLACRRQGRKVVLLAHAHRVKFTGRIPVKIIRFFCIEINKLLSSDQEDYFSEKLGLVVFV